MSSPRRFVIHGSGAVGGVLGAALWASGHAVTLLARGAHLEALRARGLQVRTPDGNVEHRIPAVEHPADANIDSATIVILTVKSQDSYQALNALARAAPSDLVVVCAQNGVENERAALRLFGRVYAASVIIPATHLEPGIVEVGAWPLMGVLEIGRYPRGADETATEVASALTEAGFAARAVGDVMRWKYAKLLSNLGNAVNAITGSGAHDGPLYLRARAEALACYAAAGIEYTPAAEDQARRDLMIASRPMAAVGSTRPASSWQSLARSTGAVETDFLNGEVVLLGRLYGVATPVNEALQRVARRMAAEYAKPGSVPAEAVLADADRLLEGSDAQMDA